MSRRITTSKRLRKPQIVTVPWEDHFQQVYRLPENAVAPKTVTVRHNLKSSTMVCEFILAGLKWKSTMRVPRGAFK